MAEVFGVPMIRWLESNGYNVTYVTGVDVERIGVDRAANLLTSRKAYMSVGHDEYWSAGQRANVEAARDAGTHLNFFSGNAAGAIWVAPLPERGDGGGLYVFRLTPLRHGDGLVDLSVEAIPYEGALMALDWNRALRQTLLSDVRTLQWHYQDGQTGQWTQEWDAAKTTYPARIRLELADARGEWPPMVFPLVRAR